MHFMSDGEGLQHGRIDEPTRKPTYAELESRVRSLEQALCDQKTTEEELRRSEARYRGLFNSAMTHLVTNAWEAIEGPGSVHMAISVGRASDFSGSRFYPPDGSLFKDSYACVSISDTGCGLAENEVDRIFDPFFTTKFTGRGLSLAVVPGIIKSWCGMIGVEI